MAIHANSTPVPGPKRPLPPCLTEAPPPSAHPADEFRALPVMEVVPAGHIAFPILKADWEPQLHPGEFAVLDTADTRIQFGELYGLMVESRRGPLLHIVQPYRSTLFRDPGAVMYRFTANTPGVRYYVDGPLRLEWWHRKCRGRVVGVLTPPAGGWHV